eukprot:TRINITY_DN4709_c0_g1_i1.p1 TRINITY_DN4709_c0_g1~~TRINITY_DN4709_c0_g1_i1.p1  ORF type:complete len:809 (+),score=232.62 TRINITY_DN4709_c0_g1_i1:211-2427(+)
MARISELSKEEEGAASEATDDDPHHRHHHGGDARGGSRVRRGRRNRIAVTNPRKVGAVSVARRVAKERGVELGTEVGFTVRFTDCSSRDTHIKYLTDGCLLRECVTDPQLSMYDVVILDEAHERSVNTDVMFGLLKQTLKQRPDFRLMVTSATLDAKKFSSFFGGCPVITVPGRVHPVECLYIEPRNTSMLGNAAQSINLAPTIDIVSKIHLKEGPGDVLVFLTGQEEIQQACKYLDDRMQEIYEESPKVFDGVQDLLILPLYAALPPEEQVTVFEPTPPNTRKVVFATNIAETSITINGIVYVVDPGFVKQKWYSAGSGMDLLRVGLISKTAAEQRLGRAGRTQPGKCFRLYPRALYDDMEADTLPEIQRVSLQGTVLYLKELGVRDLGSFGFLDPPQDATLAEALEQLLHLGALDDQGDVTPLGRQMAQFPIEPLLSRILVESVHRGCANEMLTIVAMLSVENLFVRGYKKQQELAAMAAKQLFYETEQEYGLGDHFLLLHVFEEWRRRGCDRAWCREFFVNSNGMHTAQQIRIQLGDQLRGNRQLAQALHDSTLRDATDAGDLRVRVLQCMCCGFFKQTARRQLSDEQFLLNNRGMQPPVLLHPSSMLSGRETDLGWVVFHNLTWTSRGFMRNVSPIEWEWIKPFYDKMAKADTRALLGDALYARIAAARLAAEAEKARLAGTAEVFEEQQETPEQAEERRKQHEAKYRRTNTDKSVEEARRRYLERKKQHCAKR